MSIKNMPLSRLIQMDPISAAHARQGWAWSKHKDGIILPAGLSYEMFTGDSILDPQPDGFYQAVAPTGDEGRLFYVSPNGDDLNDGLTRETAIKSIPRLQTLSSGRSGKNDVIMFDCMGDHIGSLSFITPGGAGNKVLGFYNAIAATAHYGYARRPLLQQTYALYQSLFTNYAAAFAGTPLQNVVFSGLDLYCERKDPHHPSFSGEPQGFALFSAQNVLVEDCRFMFTELTIQAVNALRCNNVTISRNIFYASYHAGSSYSINNRPSNMFVKGADSFHAKENFSDLGGWHPDVTDAGANSRNHNWYLAEYDGIVEGIEIGNLNDFHVEKNIFLRGSSHGLHQRPGGLQEKNFSARCSVGMQLGYNNHPLKEDWQAISRYNVVTEGSMQERGINACQPGAACTGAIWGMSFATADSGPVRFEIHDNIVSGLASGTDYRTSERLIYEIKKDFEGDIVTATKSNNIAYQWLTPTQGVGPNYLDPGRTLADYHAFHGGSGSFDECAAHFRERPLRAWNPNCTGDAIQQWVREGFQIVE